MVFQYTPSSVQPPRFSGGPDTGQLAQLIAGKNDAWAQGMSVLGQGLGMMREKQKEQAKKEWLGNLGQRINDATSKKDVAAFEHLPEWAWLGDDEITETQDVEGPEGPQLGKKVTLQESGRSRWIKKMNETDMSAGEKEAMHAMLTQKRERKIIDESAMHSLLAEGYDLGIDPRQIQQAMQSFGGNASVGDSDLRDDIRDELASAGFGKIDYDAPHPLKQELMYATSEQQADQILARHAMKYGIHPTEVGSFLPGMKQLVAEGTTLKDIEDRLKAFFPSQVARTLEMSGMQGPIQADAFRSFKNASELAKTFDPQQVFELKEGGGALRGELNAYGDHPITLYANGEWSTVSPKLTEMLNQATQKMSPEKKQAMLQKVLQTDNPMWGGSGGAGGTPNPYGHPGVPQPAPPMGGPSPTPGPPAPGPPVAAAVQGGAGEGIVPFSARYVDKTQEAKDKPDGLGKGGTRADAGGVEYKANIPDIGAVVGDVTGAFKGAAGAIAGELKGQALEATRAMGLSDFASEADRKELDRRRRLEDQDPWAGVERGGLMPGETPQMAGWPKDAVSMSFSTQKVAGGDGKIYRGQGPDGQWYAIMPAKTGGYGAMRLKEGVDRNTPSAERYEFMGGRVYRTREQAEMHLKQNLSRQYPSTEGEAPKKKGHTMGAPAGEYVQPPKTIDQVLRWGGRSDADLKRNRERLLNSVFDIKVDKSRWKTRTDEEFNRGGRN